MELRLLPWAVILLAGALLPGTDQRIIHSRQARSANRHFPDSFLPTFRRDSVEKVPQWQEVSDRSAAYSEEFGSKSLPLRAAVESVPNILATTRRLPLRDAVESLPGGNLIDEDTETINSVNYDSVPIYRSPNQQNFRPIFVEQPYSILASRLSPQGYAYSQSYYVQSPQSYYTPLQQFQTILGDYRDAAPYRVDNYNQQALGYSPFRLGRSAWRNKEDGKSLYGNHPYLRVSEQNQLALDDETKFDNTNEQPKRIVCYVQGAAVYRRQPLTFTAEDLDPFACTHVIYAFASVDPHTFQLTPNDEDYDVVQGGYLAVTGLKLQNPDLKVLISVGGGRKDISHRFTLLTSSSTHRMEFIRSAIAFIKEFNFDGLDIHWQSPGLQEYGGRLSDKEHLHLLLEELSETFRPNNWLLTIAAPASRFRIEDGFNPATLGELVDFVNVQAYDFHNDREPVADHHSPLYARTEDSGLDLFYSVDYSVKYWLKKGLPRSKLVLGIPFFGRSFTLASSGNSSAISGPGREGYYTQHPGFLSYFEICDLLHAAGGSIQRQIDGSGSPYVIQGDQWIGYDDVESIEQKVNYVKEMMLGGVFVWAADLDDFRGLCGEKWPLLTSIKRNLLEVDVPSLHSQPPSPTKPTGTCDSDGVYSDRRSCTAYYVCRDGFSYHLTCGSAMMYDPTRGQCDYMTPEQCRPGETVHIHGKARADLALLHAKRDKAQLSVEGDEMLRMGGLLKSKPTGPKVVCYLTNWAFYRKSDGKFVPEHIDQRLCTHVVYAFASLDPENLIMKEFDPWADLDNNLYQRVTSLRDITVLLSLGGWTDSSGNKYSKLVSDGSSRRRFVVGAVSFLRKHGFQGLHLDWNYPVCWQSNCKKGPSSDKPNFTKLLQELRQEFNKQNPPLVLAVAISGYKEVIDVSYELPAIGQAVDFMSVMTYDYHGSWEGRTGHVSPLYERTGDRYPQYNNNYTLEYLVSMGAPREKLLAGIPFYGQTFTLARHDGDYGYGAVTSGAGEAGEYTRQPGMLAYYEICHRVRNQRWVVDGQRDNGGVLAPYAYNLDQWVGYDDVDAIREKAKYIKSAGFGGAVAWTVDLDDFNNRCCAGAFPLLHSLNRGLGRISDNGAMTSSVGDCTKPPEPVTPPAPVLTTGVDSGAAVTEQMHTTSKPVSSTWWSPEPTTITTTDKPTTTTRKTTTTRTTTTRKPTTTPAWWTPEGTTIPPPAVVMPEIETQKPEHCDAGQYTPDPHNCNSYYRCILGELKKQYCAGGLHWNKERSTCDWPANAMCEDKHSEAEQDNSATTSSPWQTTTKRTKPIVTTTKRPTTTESNVEQLPTKCENGQYYPHKQCSSFYVCVNNQLLSQPCAPGLQWNVAEKSCDWKHKIKCLERKQLGLGTMLKYGIEIDEVKSHMPYSSCESGSFSSFAGDCTQYLICMWGKYEPFVCASGLHWNEERKVCDWPDNAKCTEHSVSHDEDPMAPPSTGGGGGGGDYTPATTTTTTTTVAPPPVHLDPQSGYFKIVCYFTNWAWYRRGLGKYTPEDIDANLCTHIVYGFAVLDYENLVVKAHDSWADFDNKFYERVTDFKSKGLKVTLAIGGWNDSQGDKYSRLVNNPAARAKFIKNVIEFLEKHNFDGLDLDWEYPKCWQVDCKKGPDSDKQGFAAWVKELKEAFRPKGYLLSAAVSPSKTVIDAGYDVPVLAEYLDWVAVMTYDYHGQWDKQTGHVAPLYVHPEDDVVFFNSNYSINYWISEGVPRRKIIMGMPLYGQAFQLEKAAENGLGAKAPGPGQAGEFTRAAGFLAYYEICEKVKPGGGWSVVQDPKRRMGPYAYSGNQWVSYDDKEMIRLKSEFIRRNDLGGGMIWALDLDDFKNRCGEGKHPLLTTIRQVLAAPGVGMTEPEPVIAEEDVPVIEPEQTSSPVITDIDMKPTSTGTDTAMGTDILNRNSEYKVVCYFTNWAWYRQGHGKYLPADIDPDLCTHIVYGFAVLNGDQMVIKPHDTWADFDNKFYEKVTALRAKGIKVLIAIGGWNDSAGDKYSKLVNNPSSRRRFIAHVVDFIKENNFDGLDLDWEYPKCWQVDCNKGPASDKPAFADFVRELNVAFKPHGWLLSAAVSPSRRVVDAGYDVPALSQYLDWIAVMCYDYHGQWDKVTGHVAPMYAHPEDADVTFNTNFTIHYWIEKGADPKKLVLGMPMYGQSFSLADNSDTGLNAPTYGGGEAGEETRARGFLAYYEICAYIKEKNWKVVYDQKGRIGPYAYLRDQWVSFDDIAMIKHKSEYIRAMGLGGGMIWALDLDDFKNVCGCEKYPLLKTINRVLRDYNSPEPTCVLGESNYDHDEPINVPQTTHKSTSTHVASTTSHPLTTHLTPSNENTDNNNNNVGGGDTSMTCSSSEGMFSAHPTNCNQYYVCNQGHRELYSCPGGLYWNEGHCDWPDNTPCKQQGSGGTGEVVTTKRPMVTTQKPYEEPGVTAATTTRRPHKPVVGGDDGYKVVCYFTNWAWYRQGDGKYLPSDIDYNLCTHITYGFAVLDGSTLTIKPHDSWADIDNEFYKKVIALQAKGIKVLIALGGWNDSLGDKYSRLANDPSARARFIDHALKFIDQWGFDGLDLDWEYPKCWQVDCNKGPDSDKQGFADLVAELSAQFRPRGLLLSTAVSPSKAVIDAGYDVPSLSEHFDWIAVMTYDFHGHWDKKTGHVAPLYYYPGDAYDYFNANFSLNYWIERGAAPKKLVMGMPLYGQSFSLADSNVRGLNAPSNGPGEAGEFTRAGGFLAFYEICERVKRRSWTVVRDPQGRIGPYAYSGNQWVSYDDVEEIRRKSQLVKDLGLGGGMIWALDLDDFRNRCGCGNHPLLKTMNHELRGTPAGSLDNCT